MRTYLRLMAAIAFLSLAACSNKNKVNLVDTNCKDEVPTLGNLRFTFDKNLVADSLLMNWDSTQYVEFDPPIPGRFRWENPNELIFSPALELPPATSFKASFTKKLLQHTKYSMGKCEDTKFHTPYLQLSSAVGLWSLRNESTNEIVPEIDLYFNYKLNPAKIKDLINLEVDGDKKEFTIQTNANDNKIILWIQGIKPEDKDLSAKVTLKKGLTPEGGNNPTSDAIENKLVIPSPYSLVVQNVEADHDGTMGTIKVFTSQLPLGENLSSFITLNPAANFKAEVTAEGFMIMSEGFDVAKSYELTLKKGLKGKIGGTLKEEYSTTVAFGKLEPTVEFVNRKGVYLSGKGAKNIEVKIVNVPRVKIVISKIYENNLMAAERYGYRPQENYNSNNNSDGEEYDGDYEGDYYYEDYSYGSDAVFGDVIYEKEIDTKTLPRYGSSRLFKFNLEDKLKDFKGIYHIMIRSTDDYWRKDSRFISLSDIGLIAKQASDKVYVFANSIKTAEAMSGVNVTLYGQNNQVVGNATTSSDGIAEITLKNKEFNGFKSAMITAKSGDDFNYLPFNTTRVETSRFDVGGRRKNITGLEAFVYGDRDIYRPGEKVNFSVIMRTAKWQSPGELPVKMKLLLPNGKELKTMKKTLNEQGSLETSIELSPSAVTGSYTFEVYTSNDILIATKSILIEEFMPDRIRVNAELDKTSLKPGDEAALHITAMNFFGPPAANRNYEVEVDLKQKYFSPAKYSKYDFNLSTYNSYYDQTVMNGTTDEQGEATESYTVSPEYTNRGILQADFFATVFDETGRPVSRKATADIYTQDIFYGLGNDGYYYYSLNQPVNFPLIALDKNEKPVSAKTHIQIIKHEYHTYLSHTYEYFRYESRREDKTLVDQEITVSGESTNYTFVPRTPGEYEIRIAKPGVNAYVSNRFYSYGSWGSSGSFEVNNEGNIDIEIDKKSYLTGEKAKVLFKAPFNGKMLVTVENDKIIQHQYVQVTNRAASIDLNLSAEYLPNAYITATLIKPHDETDMPLTVAHGFKNITVEEKSRKMAVQITAEKSVRSRTHQKVKVKAAPDSKITLAAVDEGILQITNYQTPDPYAFFYAKRALDIISYDLYPMLFPEINSSLSSTGGDGFDLSKRTNPLQNKRVKLVSYWSGIATANGSGEATFEFDIPQFSGELRLMAVAYKDESFGSSEAAMTVADPIVVSTALPRFMSPKDTVDMPVTISNTTAKATNATATVKITGPVKVVGSNTQSLSIKANSEGSALFRVVADPRIDVAKITVEVSGLGEKFVDETDITVRPPASLQKMTGAGVINGGSTVKVDFAQSKFIPGSQDYSLIVSNNPMVELADQVYNLVGYPHGCTEQTVSSAFPQLYVSDLVDLMKMDQNLKGNANYNVQEAIRKIKMRQLYSGSITLWDYEGSENWWASVYAAHFLIEAKKAGFDVDKSLIDNTLDYLANKLKNKETIDYYYNENQKRKIAPKEVAYSLYVLALAGKPQVSTMNYYKQNSDQLALDSKYILSAAFALAGDKGKAKEMLPSQFAGEVSVKETGGSFYSDLRDEGIALSVLVETDPNNPQIGIMSKHVSDKLKNRYYLSTQERAWGFLALGKIARKSAASNVTAAIKVNGKTIATTTGANTKLTSKQLGGTNVEIATTGSGRMYYFWQSEGISNDGTFKEEDSYVKVRKRFYDRYGRAISGNTFTQNDLIIVAITIEGAYTRNIDNVVITDLLPAGFEIENPRTKEIPGMDWIKDESRPTHLDIRDDRINLFVDVSGYRAQTYYYAVRAVSPGVYTMGPVMADAMYNGEIHSYNGGGIIKVVKR
jgi:uncharacterized protein YfaS (alpha-2-macroglobulin family)